MNNKILSVAIVVILLVAGAGAAIALYQPDNEKPTGETTIVDAVERTVEIPEKIDTIAAVGSSGPLRFLTMFDVGDKVIEVDKGDITDNKNGRGYSYAYPYDKLSVEENSHPDSKLESATAEKIGKLNPDLVVIGYNVWAGYQENVETLAKRCTVVVLYAPENNITDKDGNLVADVKGNINIIGGILNMQDRAQDLVTGLESIIKDISNNDSESKENVYVAGVTYKGSNPLEFTFPHYVPLILNDGNNVYNQENVWRVQKNVEEITKMMDDGKIDIMILDPSSSNKLALESSQLIMKKMMLLNTDKNPDNDIRICVTLPMVWDFINYDAMLAGSYYVKSVLYGGMTEAQLNEKVESVFELFYGDNGAKVLPGMTDFFKKFSSDNGHELPLFHEVDVVQNGDKFSFVGV